MSGEVGIQFVSLAEGQTFLRIKGCPLVGEWLQAFDPDAHEGLGEAKFTSDVEDAMRFSDFDAAKACWEQQSTVAPMTALGGPERENRPLQVVSITVVELPG